MRRKHVEEDHELRMRAVKRYDVRRQMIPAVVFFAAMIAIILVSVVKHKQAMDAGEVDITTHAMEVDYLTAAIGMDIHENVDELDDSYGDYFYLGIDFYEVRLETEFQLFDLVGTLWFDGEEQVSVVLWTYDAEAVAPEEVAAMAEELTTAYGAYVQDEDGVYWWYADEDGGLGSNELVAWVSCGLDEDGVLVIEACAQ